MLFLSKAVDLASFITLNKAHCKCTEVPLWMVASQQEHFFLVTQVLLYYIFNIFKDNKKNENTDSTGRLGV